MPKRKRPAGLRIYARSASKPRYQKTMRRGKSARRRKSFKKRRITKRKIMQRNIKVDNLLSKQHYTIPYMDYVVTEGVTNSAATQNMWATQQNGSEGNGASEPAPFTNLALLDGQVLQPIFNVASTYSTGGNPKNTPKMLINGYHTSMRIKNISSGDIEFVHYRVRARKDFLAGSSSLSSINAAISNQNASADSVGAAGVAKTLHTTYGASIFDLPNLCTFVKVVKAYNPRFLKPNQAINLAYRLKHPKIVKWNDYSQPTSDSDTSGAPAADGKTECPRPILKGASFSIFVIRGTAATNVAANNRYELGVGNASVLIQAKVRVDFQVINPNQVSAQTMQAVQGFAAGECSYPMPITGVYQIHDVVNPTTGARVPITSTEDVIPDFNMETGI